jgi:hypothetical protein
VYDGFEMSDFIAEINEYAGGDDSDVSVYEVSDEVRENESIPTHVYYLSDGIDADGFEEVESYEAIRQSDLGYDPEQTPANGIVDIGEYEDDVGFVPIIEGFQSSTDGGDLDLGSDEDLGLSDGLNASDYTLVRPDNTLNYTSNNERFSIDDLVSVDVNGSSIDYSFAPETIGVLPGSENRLKIVFDSDYRIMPDTFSFEFDVRSVPGFASESKNESVGEDGRAEVEVGTDSVTTSVDVSAEEGSNVSVESYEQLSVAPPEPESEFVGGVGVEVTKNEKKVEASGNITVSYDQGVLDSNDLDEGSMEVYYFNESRGEWTGEGVEVVDRDVEDNTVTAEADHFSTYAVFADQEEPTETGDNTVDGFDGPVEFAPPRDEEEEVNDSEPQDESDGEDDIQQNDTQEDDEDGSDDDTGLEQGDDESTAGPQQDSGPENPAGPTGLFTGQSGNVVLGLMALLVAVLAVLQYVGRVDVRELGSFFEGWRRS